MHRSLPFMLAASLGLTSAVRAQTPAPTGSVRVMPRFEVSAPREKPLTSASFDQMARQAGRIPGGAEIIDPAGFSEGRASSFKDFLGRAIGVYLASDNAGEVTRISMRGSGIQSDEPLGVQVLLDGLPLNQGDGEANLEEVDLTAIKAAEIHRGANALRFGSYVLGGAINLSAMTGRDGPGYRARLEGGSFGYWRGSIGAGVVAGRTDADVSFAGRRTDGFREHSAEDSLVFNGNFGFRFNESLENRLYLSASEWNRRLPGDVTKPDLEDNPFAADDEALEGDFRTLTRSWRIADRLVHATGGQRTELGAFFHRRDFLLHDLYETDFRLGVTDARSDNIVLFLSHSRQGTLFGRPNEWIAGLAPTHETERSANYRNDDGVIDRTRQTAGSATRGINFPIFFENDLAATDKLSVLTGAQFVWIDRNFDDRFWSDDDGDQSARQIFRALNPKLGFVYQRSAHDQLFMNVSRSFQPPSFDDLNPFEEGTNGSVIYAPLRSQHAWTLEAGSRGTRGRIEWDLAWYHSWVRNELFELNDATGRDIGTTNAPRTRHHGVEFGLDVDLLGTGEGQSPFGRLTLRQEYTLNDFRFDGDPVYRSKRIAGIPIHLYELELTYRHPVGLYLGPNLESSLTRYPADHANTLHADGYTILGLKAGYHGKRFTVFFDARNLADRRYAAMVKPIPDVSTADDDDLAIFAPGPGRSFFGGVSFDW